VHRAKQNDTTQALGSRLDELRAAVWTQADPPHVTSVTVLTSHPY